MWEGVEGGGEQMMTKNNERWDLIAAKIKGALKKNHKYFSICIKDASSNVLS